jgi:cytochrome c biogenesis protein CcmG/thiol:disulfide interchange protein DsbE
MSDATLPPRPRHTALWGAVIVGVVIALLVAVLATRKSAADVEAASPLIGLPAPPLAGADLSGRPRQLADFHGKYVLVNFFASWCVDCKREHPDLVLFNQHHAGDTRVAFLGVIYDDDPALVTKFFASEGGAWPVINAKSAKVDFGTTGVPETFLISPNGIVLKRIVGAVTVGGLERLVSAAEARQA